MKVFFDTNVLIDFLIGREPFADEAALVVAMCDRGELDGCFSSLTACDIVYVLRRAVGQSVLRRRIVELSEIIEMLDTRAIEVKTALAGEDVDFEDSVQRICAEENAVDVIITRDKTGFANASIPVLTPSEFASSYLSDS